MRSTVTPSIFVYGNFIGPLDSLGCTAASADWTLIGWHNMRGDLPP
jgi:hypothetical protein